MDRRGFLTGLLSTTALTGTSSSGVVMTAGADSVWCAGIEFELARGPTSRALFVDCEFSGRESALTLVPHNLELLTAPEWGHHATST